MKRLLSDNFTTELQKPLVKFGLVLIITIVVFSWLIVPWFNWRALKVEQINFTRDSIRSSAEIDDNTERYQQSVDENVRQF